MDCSLKYSFNWRAIFWYKNLNFLGEKWIWISKCPFKHMHFMYLMLTLSTLNPPFWLALFLCYKSNSLMLCVTYIVIVLQWILLPLPILTELMNVFTAERLHTAVHTVQNSLVVKRIWNSMRRLIQVSACYNSSDSVWNSRTLSSQRIRTAQRSQQYCKSKYFCEKKFPRFKGFWHCAASTVIIRQLAKGYFCEFLFLCFCLCSQNWWK